MKERYFNCDVLRIIAFIFVIAIHSLSYLGFYNQINEGIIMLCLNVLRCLFIICVPLFLVLTGYLMENKDSFNKQYVFKLFRVMVTYILCRVVYFLFVYLYTGQLISIKDGFFSILAFSGDTYGWYVDMYFGLYLMIPFFNILWNNLKDVNQKRTLIFVLSFLIVLPTLINIHNFTDLTWFLHPSLDRTYNLIIPGYFMGQSWIVLYYFIGKHLKEYPLKLSKMKNILFLIISLILFGLFNFYRNYNSYFAWESYVDYYSFESLIVTLLFANLILHHFKGNIRNRNFIKFVSKVSYLTFGGYLLSIIFDKIYYPLVVEHTLYLKDRLIFMIPLIITIAVSSLLLAYFVDLMQKTLKWCYQKIKKLGRRC